MKTQTSKTIELTITAALALCLVVPLAIRTAAQDNRHRKVAIITFDPPGSTLTLAFAINPAGTIAGYFFDASSVAHGFLRAPGGTFTTFDAPGAGTGVGQGTAVYSINPGGALSGITIDASNVVHGFLRARDGTFTTFDAPEAGTSHYQGTYAYNINPEGAIAGQSRDASNVYHGFLRTPDGGITLFEAPGAGTVPGQGTVVASVEGLNAEGAIAVGYVNTGDLLSGTQVLQGAVRAPDGSFTEFDVPGAGTGPGQGTYVAGINAAGTIPGNYTDSSGVNHGFVRARDGEITEFDVPGAGTGSGQGTFGQNINTPGDVDGMYIDGSGVAHGFLRTKHGAITTFDVPGAGTASGQGTFPQQNNPADAITGWYIDANGVQHGFLRTPCGRERGQDYRKGCEDDDQGVTAETRANPASIMQSPRTENQLNPGFPGLSPMLGRLLPRYRNVSAQPATP